VSSLVILFFLVVIAGVLYYRRRRRVIPRKRSLLPPVTKKGPEYCEVLANVNPKVVDYKFVDSPLNRFVVDRDETHIPLYVPTSRRFYMYILDRLAPAPMYKKQVDEIRKYIQKIKVRRLKTEKKS